MSKRLSTDGLHELSEAVARRSYKPADHGVGIVHLGIGAFHRAHQAIYTDDVLRGSGGDWRITGVSLRSRAVAEQLNPQDGLYTVMTRSGEGDTCRVIGSVARVLVAPEDPAAVLQAMADPAVKIVSLTVTEKGYCHDPATGRLNKAHPDIMNDLAHPDSTRTAIGFIVRGLELRYATGIAPFTVLSCDNLPHNGALVRDLVLRFAELAEPDLVDWITKKVTFPSTMVDRIVPATTPDVLARGEALLGVRDEGLVAAEPFSQWVLEDKFCNGRPRWEAVGALMVEDVSPFETAKLRLLNGTHSALAYLGLRTGHTYMHEAVANPALLTYAKRLMCTESAPSLDAPPGLDLDTYVGDLLDRFANPALNHKCFQIAMDGSQKLPQRLLDTARHHLANDGSIDAVALAVAAWMCHVTGIGPDGTPHEVQDPITDTLQRACEKAGNNAGTLSNELLSIDIIFGSDLPEDSRFRRAVTNWLHILLGMETTTALQSFQESSIA